MNKILWTVKIFCVEGPQSRKYENLITENINFSSKTYIKK